ncbi:hypothetical protein IAI10_23355 [Clostridium sp. 19966]|uniref:DUF5700 domain-containing putative Zn-dependent protease n=1 Tax=Clostridium sp. 19966 TaxID=2768166 RepID=UPI0028DF5D60|nr:DUF5700 domain-containing putative Zn-dependent protease [Clostridium sp. 19966]MDT8719584.1 hypothetical protein [Clostridium sp. 19966]
MSYRIRYSTIIPMLKLLKKLKEKGIDRSEIEEILSHEDYEFEFSRYKGRVSKEEYIDYILNLPSISDKALENEDLRVHHDFYLRFLEKPDRYINEADKWISILTTDLFDRQIEEALKGLPEDVELPNLNFIFTAGIGRSGGYVHKNGMHFDILQLMINNQSMEEFGTVISHEVHHQGMETIHNKLDLNNLPLEQIFFVYFSGEGLAVKYCNNAEGVMSKAIHAGAKNIGMDKFTWKYLNDDFYNTMEHFRKTLNQIRNNDIKTLEELEQDFYDYWMNPYIEGQSKNEIPKLLQFRLYSFGNEIWGIIHDCFGKDKVYETLRNPENFRAVFNEALEKIGHAEYKI